ncbi:hypothetical protein [Listeria fleischmannii]|uniref:hypothetical protein n=1 Tax=Listeria fleischmannii TaxID=1069827 RepID=UPI0004BAB184|nr:hypothetical protein [Listeria fleischmannii]
MILRNLTEQQEIAKQLQKSTLTKYVLNAHENETKKNYHGNCMMVSHKKCTVP